MEGVVSAFAHERDMQTTTTTWLTPRWVLDPLGEFDLDPCGHPTHHTAGTMYCWPDQDGLWLPWFGRVWCNPPYGNEAKAFIERMALHGNGYLLVFARTETEAWGRIWSTADAMLFLYRRVAFISSDGRESDGGAAPSVLAAFGEENVNVLLRAKQSGALQGALVTEWRA
jgi:DNA N-6-adenine-methyltransferase (Dam)